MDAKERYYWDLTGHLVVRNVLSQDEIDEVTHALDSVSQGIREGRPGRGSQGSDALDGAPARWYSGENLLNLPHPHCEPFRKLLAHPQVVSRLNVMCGSGFRLDHGPQYNNALPGAEGLTLHGQGEPHGEWVAYHHQNGKPYCGGVTVTWNFTDCPEGQGGFAAVPGSHKSKFRMPRGVRMCDDDMGAVVNPDIRAGDALFFMDGAQTHGSFPWRNSWERKSVLYKYASRTSCRTGVASQISAPEVYWDAATVADMTDEERAVMYGPCSSPRSDGPYLTVAEDGVVTLKNPEAGR